MKEKILSALKTKYKNLGFGDKAFDGVAEYLSGNVTEESQIETAIAGVEILLKSFQGDIDKVRTEKSELQKKYDELEKSQGGTPKKEEEPDQMPAWFKTYKEEQDKIIERLQDENVKFRQEKDLANRQSFISGELKRLGIDENDLKFLNIPDSLDNDGITNHLTAYKQYQIDKGLPGGQQYPQALDNEAMQQEAASIVDAYSGNN